MPGTQKLKLPLVPGSPTLRGEESSRGSLWGPQGRLDKGRLRTLCGSAQGQAASGVPSPGLSGMLMSHSVAPVLSTFR